MASVAKIVSPVAAPMPVMKPEAWPLFKVRWMHNMPMGPNGMDAASPTMIPFNRYSSMPAYCKPNFSLMNLSMKSAVASSPSMDEFMHRW